MRDFKHELKGCKAPKVKLNRRKQEQQPRDWRKICLRLLRVSVFAGGATLVVAAVMLGVQFMRESDYFTVKNVRVIAQSRVSEQEIAGISEVRLGVGIFDLDLAAIGRKIEENPWVARAEVVRSLPDEVVISVTEHEPRAVVQLDYLYYVNDDGEVFKLLDSSDRLDYPIITGIDRQYLLDHADEGRAWLRQSLALAGELGKRPMFNLADVSEIRIDPDGGLAVHTRQHGVPVLFGSDDFADKLDRLEQIYNELEPRLTALHYIDLNVADRVIVKVDPKYAAVRNEKKGKKGVS